MKREGDAEKDLPVADSNFLWLTGPKVTREAQSHSSRVAARRRRQHAAAAAAAGRQEGTSRRGGSRSSASSLSSSRPIAARILKKELDEQQIEEVVKPNPTDLSNRDEEDAETISKPDPKTLLTATRSDPFDCLPFSDPRVSYFINKFVDVDYRIFGLLDAAKYRPSYPALKLALMSPVSTMCIAAYSSASANPVHDPGPEATQMKLRAIRLVNDNLHNIDEILIYAVGFLWNLEARFGDTEAQRYHRSGLEEMVRRYGGWDCLSQQSQERIGWLGMTLPGTFHLSDDSREMHLQKGFRKLIAFGDAVHALSLRPESPYVREAKAFVKFRNMYQLLSDTNTPQGIVFRAQPKIHALCRLGILMYIHAIFLAHRDSVLGLRAELKQLQEWLETKLDRFTSVASLTSMIFNHKALPKTYSPDKGPLILQMTMAAKRLNPETLSSLLMLFFGYLSGRTYTPYERSLLWDPDLLEEEARLAGYE